MKFEILSDRKVLKKWGKIALVILPVLFWTAWYYSIKYISKFNEFVQNYGDEWLEDFMRD